MAKVLIAGEAVGKYASLQLDLVTEGITSW